MGASKQNGREALKTRLNAYIESGLLSAKGQKIDADTLAEAILADGTAHVLLEKLDQGKRVVFSENPKKEPRKLLTPEQIQVVTRAHGFLPETFQAGSSSILRLAEHLKQKGLDSPLLSGEMPETDDDED